MSNWYGNNKLKINLVIDVIMFLNLLAMAGIGFLLKYVLLPGFKRNMVYGSDVELYFWNMTRHDWGYIHLILGFLFLVLLLLHIILHWSNITGIFKRMVSGTITRGFIAYLLLIIGALLLIAPFFLEPEVAALPRQHLHQRKDAFYVKDTSANKQGKVTPGINDKHKMEGRDQDRLYKNRHVHDETQDTLHEHDHHALKEDIEVFGYMTLEEVASRYDVSAVKLANAINVPESKTDVRLGLLRKQYNFSMNDIREQVLKQKQEGL